MLQSRWQERALSESVEVHEMGPALLQTVAGVFEVTTSRQGSGVIVNDLVGLGTYEVEEREAADELLVGDLIVGRLLPTSPGAHTFSPAAGAFRNAELREALRGDLERMRGARRGVMRVQQNELEKLFFSSEAEFAQEKAAASYEEGQQRALEAMRSASVAPDTCGEVLNAVGDSIQVGDPSLVNAIVEQLAFDTSVDLDELRRGFAEMKAAFQRRQQGKTAGSDEKSSAGGSVQDALAQFDRGRAAGNDLEQLFNTLEGDLGVDAGETENLSIDGEAAGFPGVVGAIVDEFLWDMERVHGEAEARRCTPLRLLARYAEKIDVFEEFGAKHLLDFSARWLLDEAELEPAQASEVLDALDTFCAWCEEQHSHPLHTVFARTLESLKASVPRLLELRRNATSKGPLSPGAYRVCNVDEQHALVERVQPADDDEIERRDVVLTPTEAGILRNDDLVCLTESLPARIGSCYPAELVDALVPDM